MSRLRRELNDYLDQALERVRRGHEREPEQTAAFRRVLQTAVLHVQSAQRAEVGAGDILAAMLQQPKSEAARQLEAQGVTRLDILDFISHGISKVPPTGTDSGDDGGEAPVEGGEGPAGGRASAKDPLAAYCTNL